MLFECRFYATKEMYKEYIKKVVYRKMNITCIVLSILAVLTILFSIRNNPVLAAVEGTCLVIILAVAIISPRVLLKRLMEMDRILQNGSAPECVVEFGDNIRMTQGGQSVAIEYDQVFRIYQMKTCSILMFTKQNGIMYVEDKFTRGNSRDFDRFILEKCPRAKRIGGHPAARPDR